MKRTLAIVAVLGMSTAISGCFLSSEDKPAAAPAQEQAGPAWKLSLLSKCAGEIAQCVAGYGFALTADGKYIVGPAPAGQTASGTLTPEEFSVLKEKLAALNAPAASDANQPGEAAHADTAAPQEACQALSANEGDQLVLTIAGKEKVLAQSHDAQLCFQSTNGQAAAELHEVVRELAAHYYPVPFPDACSDQLHALQGLYATVQSCAVDADCVYVDSEFKAIPPSGDQWVSTGSCTSVQPLAVASNKTLIAHQEDLMQALKAAQSACGLTANFGSCEGFNSNVGAPRCEQGVCRIHTPSQPANGSAPAQPSAPAAGTPAAPADAGNAGPATPADAGNGDAAPAAPAQPGAAQPRAHR